MKNFQAFLDRIDEPVKRERMREVLNFIKDQFPQLNGEIRWNQPMFTDHETFIIGFSVAKEHIAVSPEAVAIKLFKNEIKESKYTSTEKMFRIKWTDRVDWKLLRKIIAYNIEDKKETRSFWRK